ncbi:uncharacterized protein J2Z83_002357 [Virgibacillus natechei]|uniref:DUF418 domain-containing protein n=1 Tax=Virgibacillus natechei TaxID=1216297 RepID=A0ABS4IJQ3_9BACI|nr:DUF418 domain-containing protein [Virgibacillus natechei]MBP1970239.1 uncharacterized protein [Virgibacillus natechei]UZD12814.1 DUF418 domain-containing protein [Virgibacillus natechei]
MRPNTIAPHERIHSLDIIRGLALFGILLANMVAFKTLTFTDIEVFLNGATLPESTLNAGVTLFTEFFIVGKFYPMFSLLFGLGFYIFYQRLEAQAFSPRAVFYRRLVFLLVLGLFHLFFIWSGDILHVYAITGFLLPFFFHRAGKTIVFWIVGLLLVTSLVTGAFIMLSGFGLQYSMDEGMMSAAEMKQETEAGSAIMRSGSLGEILSFRITNEALPVLMQVLFVVPSILPLFLIGLYMGKNQMFHDVEKNLKKWKVLCLVGLIVGIPLTFLGVAISYHGLGLPAYLTQGIYQGINMVSGPFLMLFYVSAVVLLLRNGKIQQLFMPFASVGRMALTNYLLQSLIAVGIFYGYGAGLFGQVSSSVAFLIALVIYILQVFVSHFYLKRFKQGPMESLWRNWTYAKGA